MEYPFVIQTFRIKICLCALVFLFNLECVPTSDSVSRCVGFRVNENKLTQVFEEIDCSGTTYFITPEGERTYFEYERNGYFFSSPFSRKRIQGLDNNSDYFFLPLNKRNHWLALKGKERHSSDNPQGVYPAEYPIAGYFEEIVVLSEDKGVLLSLNAVSNKIVFDRRGGVLYVMSPDKRLKAFKAEGAQGFQETNVSEDAKLHFNSALELGMNFDHGLLGIPFAQIEKKLSQKNDSFVENAAGDLVYSDEFGFLEYRIVRLDRETHGEFVYTKKGTKESRAYRAKNAINVEYSVIANGRIWYFSMIYKDCLNSSKILSIPL